MSCFPEMYIDPDTHSRTVRQCLSAVIETRKQSLSFFNLVSQPGSQVLSPTLSLAWWEQAGEDPGDKVILSVRKKRLFQE